MLFEENEVVELKEKYVDDIKKEIIAFANTNGGTIYIGVSDSGEVVGIDDFDDVSLKISNSLRDSIIPDVTLFVSYNTLDVEGKKILEVIVERGTSRPYYIASKGLKSSGVYVRQGYSSAPCSEEAIRRMIKESDGDVFENMRARNQILTFDVAKKIFEERNLTFEKSQMKTLGLINNDGIFTNLAYLLSDQCPHIIKAATFNDKYEFQDRKEFGGSLFKQLNDAYDYLDLRNQTKATFSGLYRNDSKDYSDVAIRESLLNAIIHRDYSNLASTLISVYPNKIELVSFGGLAYNVTMDDIELGVSVCRNKKLAEIFYRLKLIEAYGTGIRKIKNAYEKSNVMPEFLSAPNSFKVVLPNMNYYNSKKLKEVNTLEDEIYNIIKKTGTTTRSEIEAKVECSPSSIVRAIKKLKENDLIDTVGSGKNIKYKIK